jgi:hypothetical protein
MRTTQHPTRCVVGLLGALLLSPRAVRAFTLSRSSRTRYPPSHKLDFGRPSQAGSSWADRPTTIASRRTAPTRTPRHPRTALSAATAVLPPTSLYLTRILFLRALALVHCVAFTVAWRQNKALIGDAGLTPARDVLDEAQRRGRTVQNERRRRRRVAQEEAQELADPKIPFPEGVQGKEDPVPAVAQVQEGASRQRQWIVQAVQVRARRLREIWWDRTDRSGRPLPTLLWLARDRNRLNLWLDGVALTGLALSAAVLVRGAANVPLLATLWLLQKSLQSVGGPWYAYGWEMQLAELTFHALPLVPLWSLASLPPLPVSAIVVWTIRWHLFRVMLGSGLIKFRSGDPKWKKLTTMDYFYETQPVPNPLTRYMHWMPRLWHKMEVLLNHFVECVAPWLLLVPALPPAWRRGAGLTQLTFQGILISTGNLSFLNWLTMVPAILCLDDALVAGLFRPATRALAASYSLPPMRRWFTPAAAVTAIPTMSTVRQVVNVAFLALIVRLSIPVIRNLLSPNQAMLASYDPFRLVNTYGAFAVVGEVREEWIISSSPDMDGWQEYDFCVKPGAVNATPRFCSPYHHRLDWQIWLAAQLRFVERSPWLYTFLAKLLQSDPATVRLIQKDPYANSTIRPKYIRVDAYRYEFHKGSDGPYWDRTFLRRVYPTQGLASLADLADAADKAASSRR